MARNTSVGLREWVALLIAVATDIIQIIFIESIAGGTAAEIIAFPILLWLLRTNEIDWILIPELIPYVNVVPLTTIAVAQVMFGQSGFFIFINRTAEGIVKAVKELV